MRNTLIGVVLIVFVSQSSCAVSGGSPPQPFVPGLIEKYEAAPEESSPDEIWSFLVGDEVVFYVPPYCCDNPGTLYDKNGNILCHPDGGITGLGDGECPRFRENQSTGIRVWRDPRLGEEK